MVLVDAEGHVRYRPCYCPRVELVKADRAPYADLGVRRVGDQLHCEVVQLAVESFRDVHESLLRRVP